MKGLVEKARECEKFGREGGGGGGGGFSSGKWHNVCGTGWVVVIVHGEISICGCRRYVSGVVRMYIHTYKHTYTHCGDLEYVGRW